MRILQIMAGGPQGGAEGFFERLVPALHRRGMETRAVIRRDGVRRAKLEKESISVAELAFGGFFDFLTPLAVRREVASFAPDIVMSWMSRAAGMTPRSQTGSFVHVGRLGGYYNLKYYRTCDHLIGNTPDIVQYILDCGWPSDRAHYLPNFVDATLAPPTPRADLGVPHGVPFILALGRLHENKAFDVLIGALASVPGAHLVIAGEGPRRNDLKALAKDVGVTDRLHMVGWRDDVAGLFAAADIFVCPSRHEPLGNVVIEAWAHGVPVVAAASSGPAMLIEDGRTGRLVPVEDVEAMAETLSTLLADASEREKLASAGRAQFEERFTEERVVSQYLSFFDEVAPGGARDKIAPGSARDKNAADGGRG